MKHYTESHKIGSVLLLLILATLSLWSFFLFIPGNDAALGAGSTQTLNTTLNITNAAPEVREVRAPTAIDLEAYGNVTIICNATIFDWDNDTLSVNATFFLNGTTNNEGVDDGNNHYSNTSCTLMTAQDREMNYSCAFSLKYFADASSDWICNISALDDDHARAYNVSSSTVNSLVAIYVPGTLDFGNLAATNVSTDDKVANITNAGNKNVTISVESWGESQGDTLAMNCTYGNIENTYMKYNKDPGQEYYAGMTSVTNAAVEIPDYIVYHRFNETHDSYNSTYWKIKIPSFAGGICTGKILFTAQDSGS